MQRFFDTTPRLMVYFVAGVSLLLLALPYWLDWFPAHSAKEHFILADDTPSTVARPVLEVSRSRARPTLDQATSPLSRFGQVRLTASRGELLQTFDLHARTGYGAEPAIYETAKPTTGAQLTGCFSGDTLTEALLIEREQPAGADAVQQTLINQYGLPTEQVDNTGATVPPSLLSPAAATDWVARMASLPFQRNLVWNDANYHMEASIHYSSPDPAQSRAIVTVHLRTTTSPLNKTLSHYTAHTLAIHPAVK